METKKEVKREFNKFADAVARLEAVKRRLGVLDTKGFEKEAGLIRARLKDVNSVSYVERAVRELEKKVVGKKRG